jgi:DNA modification methylase
VNRRAAEPYYADESVTLWHGDCIEILATTPDKSVDLILTDPPYNYGFDYGDGHDDAMDPVAYGEWCAIWFRECRRIATRVVVFPGHGNLPTWWGIERPSGVGCWYKPGNPKGGGVFQFCEWEPFLLWGKGIGGSDVIRATVNRQLDTGDHPCPKPVPLFSQIIAKAKATSVLDPFVGSGTAIVAARYLDVPVIGIEQNADYCATVVRRISQGVLDFGVTA